VKDHLIDWLNSFRLMLLPVATQEIVKSYTYCFHPVFVKTGLQKKRTTMQKRSIEAYRNLGVTACNLIKNG